MFKYIARSKLRSNPKTYMTGVFAVEKPAGVTSTKLVSDLQYIFTHSQEFAEDVKQAKALARKQLGTDKNWSEERINRRVDKIKVKVGHGGTLDPLASGVMIIGLGSGTKQLLYYLTECRKTYTATALLGHSTTTGDSEGEIVTSNPVSHITKDLITKTATKFVGDIKQTPPIFSALKMNGKPLYDYAREGLPLPKPIKSRQVKIYGIKVHEEDSLLDDHEYGKLQSKLDDNGEPLEHALANNQTLNDTPLYFSQQFLDDSSISEEEKVTNKPNPLKDGETLPENLPMFRITADVSSGTYIRSLLNDIGRAMDSSAYMVDLIRSKQSDWELGVNTFKYSDFQGRDESVWGPVLRKVLEQGHRVRVERELQAAEKVKAERDTDTVAAKESENPEEAVKKNDQTGDDNEKVPANTIEEKETVPANIREEKEAPANGEAPEYHLTESKKRPIDEVDK